MFGSSSSHSFGLDFADKITAPLFKLERQLERLVELPNKVAKSVENMNKMLGETKNLALAAASAFAGGLTGAVGGLIDLLKSGIDYGIKFGKTVVEAAKERGLVMTALETQLGDRDQASALYGRMLKLAQLTPSSNQQIISFGKRFLTSQFTGDKFDAALKASIDLQALHNDNIAGQYVYLLQKVKSKGVSMRSCHTALARLAVRVKPVAAMAASR